MVMIKKMAHSEYMAKVKQRSTPELEWQLQDAREALAAMPEGVNAGYYADEVCYIGMELKFRQGPAMFTGD